MLLLCVMHLFCSVNTIPIPGASSTRRALGAGQGGRDLRECWDESGLLRGWRLQSWQPFFQVNVWWEWFHHHHINHSGVWSQSRTLAAVAQAVRTRWPRYKLLSRVAFDDYQPNWKFHISFKDKTQTYKTMCSLKALCGVTDPRKCPHLWGVFNYMPNRASGECGIQNGTWCLDGKNTMASPGNTYYALCADAIGEPYYLLATPPSHPPTFGPTKGFLAFWKHV